MQHVSILELQTYATIKIRFGYHHCQNLLKIPEICQIISYQKWNEMNIYLGN